MRKILEAEKRKLLNIIYHQGKYFIAEPYADSTFKKEPDNIIDNYTWLVLRFMPKQRTEIKLNDVIRFGRVSFRVMELVITKEQQAQAQLALE